MKRLQSGTIKKLDLKQVRALSQPKEWSSLQQDSLIKESYQDIIPTHFYNPKLSGNLKRLADFIGGCGAGRFYMSIEPNGDLYPCVFFPHKKSVKIGNLLKNDFENL